MSINLDNVRMQLEGASTPPANMMEAARQSLSPKVFDWLMEMTGGNPPTPAQLCIVADAQRAVLLAFGTPASN